MKRRPVFGAFSFLLAATDKCVRIDVGVTMDDPLSFWRVEATAIALNIPVKSFGEFEPRDCQHLLPVKDTGNQDPLRPLRVSPC